MSKNSTHRFSSPTKPGSIAILLAFTLMMAGCAGPVQPDLDPVIPSGNGIINGQVVGKAGPVSGALVQLNYLTDESCAVANDHGLDMNVGQSEADIEMLKQCHIEFGRIPTDANGQYRFESVPPGYYAIWIHWEQNEAPNVPLRDIPPPGYYFTTLSAEIVGDHRIDVSMKEETHGVFEVDVHFHSIVFSGEGELVFDFNW